MEQADIRDVRDNGYDGDSETGEAMSLQELPVSWLDGKGGTQLRPQMDADAIVEYAHALEEGAVLPPVGVMQDRTGHYWLWDGFHRVMAHQRVGRENILADVELGELADAIDRACGANATHGLRRTPEHTKRVVLTALKQHPDAANTVIAVICHVDESTIRRLKPAPPTAPTGSAYAEPEKRTGKDGKQYPVSKAVTAKPKAEDPQAELKKLAKPLETFIDFVNKAQAISVSDEAVNAYASLHTADLVEASGHLLAGMSSHAQELARELAAARGRPHIRSLTGGR